MMLVQNAGAYSYESYHYGQLYPELSLQPTLAHSVPQAGPIPWKPSVPAPDAKPAMRRSSAEVALDLWHVAEALREMKSWQIVQGEMLSKGGRNKLRKLVPMISAKEDLAGALSPDPPGPVL